jgi:transcription initiation factor TFIID subunit 2
MDQSGRTHNEQTTLFAPLVIRIDFYIKSIRDGMHLAGWGPDDLRYPHAYSLNTPGASSCLFPCVDAIDARCTWEMSFRIPRTLGDAFDKDDTSSIALPGDMGRDHNTAGGRRPGSSLSEEDRALDLTLVCSGNLTDEVIWPAL